MALTAANLYHDIIVINLIKIVNCGKNYVMMMMMACVCVCVRACVHRSYIKFIIIFCETYIHVIKHEYSISLQRLMS